MTTTKDQTTTEPKKQDQVTEQPEADPNSLLARLFGYDIGNARIQIDSKTQEAARESSLQLMQPLQRALMQGQEEKMPTPADLWNIKRGGELDTNTDKSATAYSVIDSVIKDQMTRRDAIEKSPKMEEANLLRTLGGVAGMVGLTLGIPGLMFGGGMLNREGERQIKTLYEPWEAANDQSIKAALQFMGEQGNTDTKTRLFQNALGTALDSVNAYVVAGKEIPDGVLKSLATQAANLANDPEHFDENYNKAYMALSNRAKVPPDPKSGAEADILKQARDDAVKNARTTIQGSPTLLKAYRIQMEGKDPEAVSKALPPEVKKALSETGSDVSEAVKQMKNTPTTSYSVMIGTQGDAGSESYIQRSYWSDFISGKLPGISKDDPEQLNAMGKVSQADRNKYPEMRPLDYSAPLPVLAHQLLKSYWDRRSFREVPGGYQFYTKYGLRTVTGKQEALDRAREKMTILKGFAPRSILKGSEMTVTTTIPIEGLMLKKVFPEKITYDDWLREIDYASLDPSLWGDDFRANLDLMVPDLE